MAAANNEFFEALSMLEHERGITAEYLIEKIKAAIIIAVKKNYEVEEDHIRVDIDPDTGRFGTPRRAPARCGAGQPRRPCPDPEQRCPFRGQRG